MRRIPDRNIITGLHAVHSEHTREEHTRKYNNSQDNRGRKPVRAMTYFILIALILIMVRIVIPAIKINNYNKENQEAAAELQRAAQRQEVLSSYTFNFPQQTTFLSDTQELYNVKISYDIAYYGDETNSIKFTITGTGSPKRTQTSSGTGIYFVIAYYNSDGKAIDSGYLIDSMCKAGDQVEFTDTVFDLEPGEYSIKIFAQDDPL